MVTFIIPSVNRETLKRSVTSLINQTNSNWFCKIIFDGVEISKFDDNRIESFMVDKIGLFGPHNGQSGFVRNHGIDKVDTEWVAFLDDDDTVDVNYVELLLNKYKDYDFVIFRMKYQNGLVLPKGDNVVFGNVGISIAYKKKLNVKFKSNRDGEDYDLIVELKNRTNNYIISDEVLYNVRH